MFVLRINLRPGDGSGPATIPQQARATYRQVRRYLARAPGTLVYLFTLAVTWWTLRGADPKLVHRLLISQSTNLHNMTRNAFQVLVASAFWIDGTTFHWQVIVEFLLIMVPAERWLGTRRWLLTFAAGHIGATLITVTGIAYAIHHGLLDNRIARTSDVGVSYGFFAVAALLAYRFPDRRQRLAWAALLVGYLGISAWQVQTFSAYGHLAALAIGFSLYRVTRSPNATLARRQAKRSDCPAQRNSAETSRDPVRDQGATAGSSATGSSFRRTPPAR